ncbi:hypothetical protein UCRPA7_2760 [Phaeoacremonium minimum UCRPA7]|uniref:Uncharacterized protein n=1 Tax=Phaeoacremonium minimum (strain UCR-PA7) TaxID=1286976 RepID=R8BQX6_PHAM7|nr:hypothetical protein UCRPA7_2760 [Phaeoacremonium minimum UCRPA7]EOO01734.1 hypothetical protein UCRPA7_2760 [Phaeoacremonium minimum UCRPA7]
MASQKKTESALHNLFKNYPASFSSGADEWEAFLLSSATGRAGEEHDRVRRLLAEAGGVCAEADREGAGVGWDGGEGD